MKMRQWPLAVLRARPISSLQLNQWDPILVRWARDISRVPQPGSRPPAGYFNRAQHSKPTLHRNRTLTSWCQAPGGLGDPGRAAKCCTQIVRPQKTTQESEVACKNKEPLFGLKLGLSDLTDTADLHREPRASPWQGFYWGRARGRTSNPGGGTDWMSFRQGGLGISGLVYSNCVLAMRNVAKVIPYLVTLSKGLLCSIMIGSGLRWCIPEEGSYSGYGAFQG
jgi:hypothetical protein